MSLSGIRPFSDAERDLFDKLMDLQQEGDRTGDYSKHDALAHTLTETQNVRYDEYIAVSNDYERKMWEIQKQKAEIEAKLQKDREELAAAKAQRGVIFSQHASGFTNVLDKFTLSSQPKVVAANGAPSHTNGKKKFGW